MNLTARFDAFVLSFSVWEEWFSHPAHFYLLLAAATISILLFSGGQTDLARLMGLPVPAFYLDFLGFKVKNKKL